MPEKYQDEIEEILKGIEDTGPVATPTRESERPYQADHEPIQSGPRSTRDNGSGGLRLPSITPGKLALVGIICILIGSLSPAPTTFFILAGVSMFAGAYLMLFVRPRSIYLEKRWRGQSMDRGRTNSIR